MSNDMISRSALLEKMENVHPNAYTPSHMIWLVENEPAACDIDRIIKRLEERKAHILKEFVLAGSTQKVKDISVANINELDGIIAIIKSEVNTGHAAVQKDKEADAAAREEWIRYNTCNFCQGSHMHTCTSYSCPDAAKKAAEHYDSQIK